MGHGANPLMDRTVVVVVFFGVVAMVREWCFFTFWHRSVEACFAPERRAFFQHLKFQKLSGEWCVFNMFTSKSALRHNPFTFSKDLNFQKWSDTAVFCTFLLPNVLRATTPCTFWISRLPKVFRTWCVLHVLTWNIFWTSQLPKVLRTCGVLHILTSKCASRHNGVHFFDMSTGKSAPGGRCF